jgi:hypothetical protein
LNHPEKVGFVVFPACDQTTEVVQPSEQSFDFPAAAVTPQFAAILSLNTMHGVVRSDQANAMFLKEPMIQRVAIVGPIPN